MFTEPKEFTWTKNKHTLKVTFVEWTFIHPAPGLLVVLGKTSRGNWASVVARWHPMLDEVIQIDKLGGNNPAEGLCPMDGRCHSLTERYIDTLCLDWVESTEEEW